MLEIIFIALFALAIAWSVERTIYAINLKEELQQASCKIEDRNREINLLAQKLAASRSTYNELIQKIHRIRKEHECNSYEIRKISKEGHKT